MMLPRKALGKGLASLIPNLPKISSIESVATVEVAPVLDERSAVVHIDSIIPNRQQPRTEFDNQKLEELAASIRHSGIIQPLVVRSIGGGRYELIAGERRLRAAKLAGLAEVPIALKHDVEQDAMLEMAMVENLQRDDLNPIEEAKAFQLLAEKYSYTQEQVAQRVGKSRVAVTNSIRLLQLPKIIQDDLVQGRMDMGHARALLGLANVQDQMTVREEIIQSTLTVRDVERMVQQRRAAAGIQAMPPRTEHMTPQLRFITDEMTKSLGTKVELKPKNAKSGHIIIEYYSLQDVDRIYRRIAAHRDSTGG